MAMSASYSSASRSGAATGYWHGLLSGTVGISADRAGNWVIGHMSIITSAMKAMARTTVACGRHARRQQ